MSKFIFSLIFLSFFLVDTASAHSGRTNSSGCHNNRKTGDYHCHNSKPSSYNTNKSYNSSTPKKSSNTNQTEAHKQLVLEIQKYLNALGYKVGLADGIMGAKTKKAIEQFQNDNSLDVSGVPTSNLLTELKSKAGF